MNWLRRFMLGRNGPDHLSVAILIAALVLNIIADLTNLHFIYILAFLMLALFFFRTLSRNCEKRSEENQKFLNIWHSIKNYFLRQKDKLAQCRDYRFFKCPSCHNNLRVPKGKGRIYVTCPRCGERFIKKT